MSKIFCPLSGVSFRTQLIIMTLVDAISSLRDWSPPFNWAARIDQIWKTTISRKEINGNYDQYIKIALSWVVVSRMVIAHLYTITYAANLYTILTWCCGKLLLPWLMLSAFKNFFLESIVMLVVILLYIEGNLSGFLFMSIMMDKLIAVAVAAHNWFTINSLYVEMEPKTLRESNITNRKSDTSFSPNILLGMSMQNAILDDDNNVIDTLTDKPDTFLSLPDLGGLDIDFVSDSEVHDKFSQSNLILPASIDYEYDEQEGASVNTIDDSNLIVTENAIEILKLALDNMEDDGGRIEPEIDAITSYDLIPSIEPTLSDESGESVSCGCPTFEDADAETKVETNGNLLTTQRQRKRDEDATQKRNTIGNHSNWVNQWSLKHLLKCTESESFEKEVGPSTPSICEEYLSRWSSDEDLNSRSNSMDNLNAQNNEEDSSKTFTSYYLPDISFARMKNIDFYQQSCKSWTEHLQLVGNSIETTLQRQQINSELSQTSDYHSEQLLNRCLNDAKIRKSWILDGMSIEIVENQFKSSPEKQDTFMEPEFNSSSMEDCETAAKPSVQINFDSLTNIEIDNYTLPSYESSVTQTSIHELTQKQSYYKSLSMYNSSSKKGSDYENAYEREEKELEALTAYNAKTLWKDKRKLDIEKLKSTQGEAPKLLSKSQSLKSNNESQLSKRKQRYQSKNVGGAKKVIGNVKMSSVSCKKIQVTQVGRNLNRTKANENIRSHYSMKVLPKINAVDNTVAKRCTNKLTPTANSQLTSSTCEEFNIKNKIAQIDWTLSPWEPCADYDTSLSELSFNAELAMSDITDVNDTADLLQSAFSFDSRNTERGFYLGPASTDLYSLSEQIPNVFHEIIKATRFRPVHINCTHLSTMEIDYGELHHQELRTIGSRNGLSKAEYSMDSVPLNSNEIYAIDYWIKILLKLLLNCETNNQNLPKFKQLTQMPGFYVLRRLINNLYRSLMISVSTATSTVSIAARQSATTSTATINNNSIEQRIPQLYP